MTIKHILTPDYKLSTSSVSPREVKEYWIDLVCDQYINTDCDFQNNDFQGEVAFIDLDGVRLSEAISSPQTLRRQAKHVAKSSEENIILSLNLQGRSELEQGSDQYVVNPGDCVLGSTRQQGVWNRGADFRHLIMQVSRSKLVEQVSVNKLEFGNPLISGNGTKSKILSEFIQLVASASSHPALCVNGRKKLSAQLITAFSELIDASHGINHRIPSEILKVVLKSRADKVIKSNLRNQNLGPELLSKKLNISKRYLYKLYQDSPMSLWQTVKSQRLQKIAEILANPAYVRFDGLTGLAVEFGFTDLSHLSHSFKKQYGLSPTRFQQKMNDEKSC